MKRSKALRIFIGVFFYIIFILIFVSMQNNFISINSIVYKNIKIPQGFNGYKIAHISDLHNKRFGENQKKLLLKLKETDPDIIVLTGDMVDRRRFNLDITMEFINGAVKIAPVYYVSGNHEALSGKWQEIKSEFLKANVNILENEKIEIIKGNDKINMIGLQDINFLASRYTEGSSTKLLKEYLSNLVEEDVFSILLCHRPELIDIYAKGNADLVFTGHAHGGQIRLPFIGGLYAPDQGFLPSYTSGDYTIDNTTEIVSRGLGNSVFPIRIFNEPEIVVVTLFNK